ncbi:MAG TPA: hydrolase [Gemmataceae bacterium]|nr:hydrolase [Gemmataceae bacterium]
MAAALSPERLSVADTGLLVIDVQEKLLPKIDEPERLVRNIAFLIDACKLLNVPAWVTEQYPKGLGPTVPELAKRLPAERPDKVAFSSCAIASLVDGFHRAGRPNILVAGMETHVCVMQTVLDLIALSFRVFVAVDAVGCRYPIDHETALRRMEMAGAVPVTSEMAVFELTRVAGTSVFKEISRLVQERMKAIA